MVWCVPSLANVDDVDSIRPGLPQVWLHVHLQVLAADVALGSQEHLDILRGGIECGGEVVGSHSCGCVRAKECAGGRKKSRVPTMFGCATGIPTSA